ncbi:MAG TPA: hypothetical protein VFT32_01020 [Candidatus Eisenbacteria bacterium]|nr:hypothetical protein [Candidatus Eisenbacteria bacterium]
MSLLIRILPLAALLGAGVASGRRAEAPTIVDPAWTSSGFARNLRSAADRAEEELRRAPEIARAEIRVRSTEDHAPLEVEASIDWTSPASKERCEALLSAVKSHFDSFARVEVVARTR